MRCEPALGHEQLLAGLWRAAAAGRLAHALLLTGPEGCGKFLAAERLTLGLLCAQGPGEPCGVCGPCKRLKAGSHPDALVIDPAIEEWETIPLGAITAREGGPEVSVEGFLSLRAMEGGWRVVLLREAELLNTEAQNALLKTLEEPGQAALIVLVSSKPERLLPTVLSRCVRVACAPPAPELAVQVLARAAADLRPEQALQLARWAGGAPGAALRLHEQGALEARARIDGVLGGRLDPVAETSLVFEIPGRFVGETPAALARARVRALVDLACDVLLDGLRAQAGLDPATLRHGDLAGALAERGAAFLSQGLAALAEARQDVGLNLAPEAALERALLTLAPAARRSASAGAVR